MLRHIKEMSHNRMAHQFFFPQNSVDEHHIAPSLLSLLLNYELQLSANFAQEVSFGSKHVEVSKSVHKEKIKIQR